MCCSRGELCTGVRPGMHRSSMGDPAGLIVENKPVSAAAGRGDSTAVETRAAVARQDHEVPWLFAQTRHGERFQHEENDGTQGHVPRLYRHDLGSLDDMLPWAETHPTVLRDRPTSDDGLGGGSLCR